MNNDKHSVLGILVSATNYDDATARIASAAGAGQPMAVTALAVHGVMTGVFDDQQRYRLNHFDLVTPDGQPVRWALRLLHGVNLPDRVYGPNLTLHVLKAAEESGYGVYFYGSRPEVLTELQKNAKERFPQLKIVGTEPSRFRRLTPDERDEVIERIQASGAQIVFVGLGCPRQETWAYEYRDRLSMPVIAVGAAFDFLAGTKAQAPVWVQNAGLEWLFRLLREPGRLWRRYVLLNPTYLFLIALQKLRLRQFDVQGAQVNSELLYG
ncbi:MAG: WecB/TagA/CpsF family glycosyltransferase [Anaerolineae bacterium]|nr:WecB/TagA/CpsF family glycosyltransferase [Anaerolineae bacterium]